MENSETKAVVVKFVEKVVGPSADALGGILGDQLKSWRASNLDRIHSKWRAKVTKKGTSEACLEVLPFGDAFRVIDAASLEENESVQELWAQIIANAMDPDKEITFKKPYIDILKSLSEVDAIVLGSFIDHATKLPPIALDEAGKDKYREFAKQVECKVGSLDQREILSSLDNLIRLKVISYVATYPDSFGSVPDDGDVVAYVQTFDKEQLASSLVSVLDAVNNVSGWSLPSEFYELSSEATVLYALDKYSFTSLGFELAGACEVS
ncbi:Abi-alpha family protein [Photobacterium leiognathi]|uniref:Abi-alpha family protein n=1 Tax=Photobacterium leiognathi TaxID=553611 RepID=UPI002980A9F9|nr:Abi-alpha family protein [Photobacterium leiognathi]